MTKPTKTKARGAWAADLAALETVVARESFRPTEAAFAHAPLVPNTAGDAFICKASVRGAHARGVLVRVPDALAARLAEHTTGPQSVALAALADWALDHLLATGQQLTTRTKPDE